MSAPRPRSTLTTTLVLCIVAAAAMGSPGTPTPAEPITPFPWVSPVPPTPAPCTPTPWTPYPPPPPTPSPPAVTPPPGQPWTATPPSPPTPSPPTTLQPLWLVECTPQPTPAPPTPPPTPAPPTPSPWATPTPTPAPPSVPTTPHPTSVAAPATANTSFTATLTIANATSAEIDTPTPPTPPTATPQPTTTPHPPTSTPETLPPPGTTAAPTPVPNTASTPQPFAPWTPTPPAPPTPAPRTPAPNTPAPDTQVPQAPWTPRPTWTPQPPPPRTPQPPTPAPITPLPPPPSTPWPSSCNCHGHGVVRTFGSRCYCICDWNSGWGGRECNECRNALHSVVNGHCTSCVEGRGRMFGISGTTVQVPMQRIIPGCLDGAYLRRVLFRPLYLQETLVRDGEPTVLLVDIRVCTTVSWDEMVQVRRGSQYARIATIFCLPSFTMETPSDVPAHTHIHFVDRHDHSIQTLPYLHAIFTTATTPVVVRVTFFDDTVGRTFTVGNLGDTFAALALYLQTELKASSLYSYWWSSKPPQERDAVCVLPAAFANTSATAFIVAGDLRDCTSDTKTAFNDALAALVQRGVGVMWVGLDVSAPSYITGGSAQPTDATQMSKLYDTFQQFTVLLRPVVYTPDTLSFFPSSVPAMRRGQVFFRELKDIRACCFGPKCSPYVGSVAGRAACYTPLLPPGAAAVTAEELGTGNVRNATDALTVAFETSRYHVHFSAAWNFLYLRRRSYYDARDMNAERCCRLVVVGFDVMQFPGDLAALCFKRNYRTYNFKLPAATPNMFFSTPFVLAMQCYRPLIEDAGSQDPPALATASLLTGDRYLDDGSTNNDDELPPSAVTRDAAIDRYIKQAVNRALKSSAGRALEYVRKALHVARLESTHPPEERACGKGDKPDKQGKCFYKWCEHAKDAGPHLLSMGFVKVATDMWMNNAVVGDIAVYPRIEVYDPVVGAVVVHEGYIQIKRSHDSSPSTNWVSDFLHTKMVFGGVYEAAVRGGAAPNFLNVTGDFALYRLRAGQDPLEPPQAEEEIVPIPGVAPYVENATRWLEQWSEFDKTMVDVDEAMLAVNAHWKCPSYFEIRQGIVTWPRELNRVGPRPANATICQRTWSSPDRHYGVTCCYDARGVYIPHYPSRLTLAVPWMATWERTILETAESMSCGADGALLDSYVCRLYRARRPAPMSTNAPFNNPPLRWTPRRMWGGAFGDPHCATYDGTQYECNYHGEAVWTACGNWSVHAVAEPVNGNASAKATVISKFAVKYQTDVVTVSLSNQSADAVFGPVGFEVFLNGLSVADETTGTYLTVSVSADNVTVTDPLGNMALGTVNGPSFTLSTGPSESCRGATTGLCGNNNGDSTDDLVGADGAALPAGSSPEVVYREFVLAQLVTREDASIFPSDTFVAGNTSFTPLFSNQASKANCPAACKGDTACCFDADVGGETFVQSYNQGKGVLAESNDNSMSFTEAWPPAFRVAPPTATVPLDNATVAMVNFTAYDTDGNITHLTCTACGVGVACTVEGLGTNTSTIRVPLRTLAEGVFTCTATDSQNKTSTAVTTVVRQHVDAPSVNATAVSSVVEDAAGAAGCTASCVGIIASCAFVGLCVSVSAFIVARKFAERRAWRREPCYVAPSVGQAPDDSGADGRGSMAPVEAAEWEDGTPGSPTPASCPTPPPSPAPP